MKATLTSAPLPRTDRRARSRGMRDRRLSTPLNSWLRVYGPWAGIALMGLSAAVVVLCALLYAGVWTQVS